MEIEVHPKSKIKTGDIFKVTSVNNDRLDMARCKYICTAVLENIEDDNNDKSPDELLQEYSVLDIVDKLKRMSQWMWYNGYGIARNAIAKEAYLEIEKLRRQIITQQEHRDKSKNSD